MKQDSVKNLVNNALKANRENHYHNEEIYVSNFAKAIRENLDLFEQANQIDIDHQNGFKLDYQIMDRILKRYENVDALIHTKNDMSILDHQLLHSKLYTELGVVLVLFDGNTYTMLEMILLGLLTHNTMIFTYNGYMGGTNGLVINLIQAILEKEGLNNDMFQHSVTTRAKEFFENFKSIQKTIIIGSHEFIDRYLKDCPTEAIVCGYPYYDIYVDSLRDVNFINKILMQDNFINLYINKNLNVDVETAILVDDIDEAITSINYNGSRYCSAIFTEDNQNASKFIERIESKNVMVNASPTLEQALDIKQEDLLREKAILLPNIYNIEGTTIQTKKDDNS